MCVVLFLFSLVRTAEISETQRGKKRGQLDSYQNFLLLLWNKSSVKILYLSKSTAFRVMNWILQSWGVFEEMCYERLWKKKARLRKLHQRKKKKKSRNRLQIETEIWKLMRKMCPINVVKLQISLIYESNIHPQRWVNYFRQWLSFTTLLTCHRLGFSRRVWLLFPYIHETYLNTRPMNHLIFNKFWGRIWFIDLLLNVYFWLIESLR